MNNMVRVNRRLYDEFRSSYRIPDLRLPDIDHIFDLTVGTKTIGMSQIADFRDFAPMSRITIIRPTKLGGSFSFVF